MVDEKTARELLSVFTKDYSPEIAGDFFAYSSRLPIFTRQWIPYMERNPAVRLALAAIKGSIVAKARFFVQCQNLQVKKFVADTINRYWSYGIETTLQSIECGYAGSEVLYRAKGSELHYDQLRACHFRDVRPAVKEGYKVGMWLIRNIQGREVDRDSNNYLYIGGMKCLWTVHQREVSRWYGRSKLFGAFEPWWDHYSDGGARDIRRLFYHKYAFNGDILYFPTQTLPTPNTGAGDESLESNKSKARRMVNQRRTGGTLIFPNTKDPISGKYDWELIEATGGPPAVNINEYPIQLRSEIFDGMEVPLEAVESVESGLGQGGRDISNDGFLSTLQIIVNFLIHDFVEQVIRELVALNFSEELAQSFEVIPYGLAHNREEDRKMDQQAQMDRQDRKEEMALKNKDKSDDSVSYKETETHEFAQDVGERFGQDTYRLDRMPVVRYEDAILPLQAPKPNDRRWFYGNKVAC